MSTKSRIAVAMSGGVDSSVAAALLVESGYDVVGLTMRLTDSGECSARIPRCCSSEDIKDARNIAFQLNIPAYVIDLREDFSKKIYEYFYSSYLRGETPNPCIFCNSELKFGILLKKAADIGAEMIATGHYARQCYSEETGRFLLKRGSDTSKDQSYFLFNLTQEQLSKIVFPVGDMRKEDVRRKAKSLHLKVAEKMESQDICFSSDGDYRSFYRENEVTKPGKIIDSSGKAIGQHTGIHNFTIGQRKGIGIAHARPLYVLKIDPLENAVMVGEEEELFRNTMTVKDTNWIRWAQPPAEVRALVQIRSTHHGEQSVIKKLSDDLWQVTFDEPVKGITAGQAAVFYDGDHVIGGGWITES